MVTNEKGIEIVPMCASCAFRDDYGRHTVGADSCWCKLDEVEVGRHSLCSNWQVSDFLRMAGCGDTGRVKPKAYHIWYYMTNASENFKGSLEAYEYWKSKVKDTETMTKLAAKFYTTPASILRYVVGDKKRK